MSFQKSGTIKFFKILIVLIAIVLSYFFKDLDGAILSTPNIVDSFLYLMLVTVVYSILLAIPFLPASEIGIIIMLVSGIEGVVLVYLGTVCGLTISFLFGRNYKFRKSTSKFLESLLTFKIYRKIGSVSPSICLGLMLNIPGNVIVGGGGGISYCYGKLKQISLLRFILTVSVATLPVPLLFLIYKLGV